MLSHRLCTAPIFRKIGGADPLPAGFRDITCAEAMQYEVCCSRHVSTALWRSALSQTGFTWGKLSAS